MGDSTTKKPSAMKKIEPSNGSRKTADANNSGKSGSSKKIASEGGIIRTGPADEKAVASRRGPQASESKSGKSRRGRTNDLSKKAPEKKKKRAKTQKKSAFEKIGSMFGIFLGHVQLQDPRAIEAVQALDLSPGHLRKLKAAFNKIDIDGSGAIDFEEFFEAVGEERSPFTDKLFALIDVDGSGTIEFDEYVRVMATYCMFTKDEILRFCFECFDVDRSGTIDEKEFVELCKCVNNAAPTFPNNFKRALEDFDVNEDGLIDYSEFLEIDRRYPLILFPAFRLQDVMQRTSLGERSWIKVIEKYQESKRIEEYKATHGGRSPPDPIHKKLLKTFLPCFFQEKTHIKVGAAMEARHRMDG